MSGSSLTGTKTKEHKSRSNFGIWLCLGLLFTAAAFNIADLLIESKLSIETDISSSNASIAELYIDTGHGFNEDEAQTVSVSKATATQFQALRFPVPISTHRQVRFDPIATQGTVSLRNFHLISPWGNIWTFSSKDIIATNQISRSSQDGEKLTFTTTPGAIDPAITFDFHHDITPAEEIGCFLTPRLLVGNAILVVFFLAVYIGVTRSRRWSEVIQSELLLLADRRTRGVLFASFLASVFVSLCTYIFQQPPTLNIQLSSTTSSTARLYFDVGRHFNGLDSIARPVSKSSDGGVQDLVFPLPLAKIRALRFDPIQREGSVDVRRAVLSYPNGTTYTLDLNNLVPLNQVQLTQGHSRSTKVTIITSGANAYVLLPVDSGLEGYQLLTSFVSPAFIIANLILFALWLGIYLLITRNPRVLDKVSQGTLSAQKIIDVLAAKISLPGFLVFDRTAILFYVGCAIIFFFSVLACLNGSSAGRFYYGYGLGSEQNILYGSPKQIRIDEWACETPAILNQINRKDSFSFEKTYFGNYSVGLVCNLPVKHFTTFFRPQFWGFFALPIEYGFSAYWQFKGLLLLTGIFTLLLLLTSSSFWSAVGALWFFFSPYTQWGYSWASGIPEMAGLAGFLVVLICYLLVEQRITRLLVAAVIAVGCVINFVLLAYLPHLIPFVWLVIAVVIGWTCSNRKTVFVSKGLAYRLAALGIFAIAMCVAGFLIFNQLHSTISILSQSVYPGRRIVSGGHYPIELLISQSLPWTQTEGHYPHITGNICEAAGYLWLAPLTLFGTRGGKKSFGPLISLWCFFLGLLAWLLLPVPEPIARFFGLHLVLLGRAIPALGLASIAIVMIYIARGRRSGGSHGPIQLFFWLCLVYFLIVTSANRGLGNFYSNFEMFVGVIALSSISLFLLRPYRFAFAGAIVLSHMLLFGQINPIQRGLKTIQESELSKFVHTHDKLLSGKWLVYSEEHVASGFLAATGCNVYTGIHFLPDVDTFSAFSSRQIDTRIINRACFLAARPISAGVNPSAENPVEGGVLLKVNPSDKLLSDIGISYVAFDKEPAPEMLKSLESLANNPVSGLWLYKRIKTEPVMRPN